MKKLCALALLTLLILALTGSAFAGSTATDLLLAKARSLEGRGRLDLAAQSWQQVLMADPNQPEALAGLARWAQQNGRTEETQQYLDRLRAVNPNDPAIARITAMKVIGPKQRAQLDEAGRLANAHKYEESMRIYREVLGDEPPPGNWAIAYYETEAAIPDGYPAAVDGLRRLSDKFPSDMAYRLSLGRLLTYRPKSRVDGMHLLSTIPLNSAESEPAKQAWRQALVWNGPAPAGLPLLRDYLKRYPDPELEAYLKKGEEAQQGVAASELSRDLQQGYAALNADNLLAADAAFNAELKRNPRSSEALSGLGYVRMKQKDFAGAIHYFEQAKSAAPTDTKIQQALETARFWSIMSQGTNAMAAGQTTMAESYFQQAVGMRPQNMQALQGYAGALMKEGKPQSAVSFYQQITQSAPNDAEAWRGLLQAQMSAGEPGGAAETLGRIPPSVKSGMSSNLDFLILEASVYAAADQPQQAQKLVTQAMQMASSQPRGTSGEYRLQLAGLLLQIGQVPQAIGMYQQLTDLHPDNVDAWQGLVAAYLQNGDVTRAIAALQRMPKATYNIAIQNPPFLLSIAAVYRAQHQLESAEEFVQTAIQIESRTPAGPNVATQIALGKIWLEEGRTDEANNLFRSIIQKSPDDAEAWNGYIEALHQQKNNEAAIAQSEQLPEGVAQKLKSDPGYLSTMASVNAQLGQYNEALRLLRQATFHYELSRQPVPVSMQLQMGWLLLDSNSDETQLYQLLTAVGARRDLSYQQRRDVDGIWAAWSLRQAEAARLAGDTPREIAILQAALRALPYDNHIRGTLAGALLVNGDPRSAFALYRAWGLKGGDADDYRGAIGAAMAVHEDAQAQTWLNTAIRLWPENPQVMVLAAKMAQQQGDYDKARRYWEAALRTLPADQAQLASLGYAPPVARETHSLQDLARTLMPPDQVADVTSANDFGASRDQQLILPAPSAVAPVPGTSSLPPAPAYAPSGRNSNPKGTPSGNKSPAAQPISGVSLQPGGGLLDPNPQQNVTLPPPPSEQEMSPLPVPMQTAPLYSPPQNGDKRPQMVAPSSYQNYDSSQQSQRDEIEAQIAAIEGRNGPFAGVGGLVSSRSGEPGFQKLADQEAALEGSVVLGDSVRLTGIVRPVFLDSGTPTGTSIYRFGTLPLGAVFSQQSFSGLSEELQASTENFGLRFGATPTGFPVYNWVGGLRWKIGGGPITVLINRDTVKDTMLSFAGATDPGTGTTWGAVLANSGTISGSWGGAVSGAYGTIGYQYLQGTNVAANYRIDGDAGAYWRIFSRNYGSLTLGANFFAMHYNKNLTYFTLGQGGYFSPQQYFLFNTPVRWIGTYKRGFEYSITGSIGSQQFKENPSPYFPDNAGLQASSGMYYPGQSVVGVSYNLSFRGDYRLPSNWYMGAFANFNNARDYNQQTIGFNVRYLFHNRPMTLEAPVQTIPDWRGFQPFQLPQ